MISPFCRKWLLFLRPHLQNVHDSLFPIHLSLSHFAPKLQTAEIAPITHMFFQILQTKKLPTPPLLNNFQPSPILNDPENTHPSPLSPSHFTYWGPPSTRLAITSHEDSLTYKYLVYENHQTSSDNVLYYKWCWWSGGSLNIEEVLETEYQVSRRICGLKQKDLPVHLMRLGAIPYVKNDEFIHSDRLFITVHLNDLEVFEEMCFFVVTDCLYEPMDTQSMYSESLDIDDVTDV